MFKALVTGATGFLGGALAARLHAEGIAVRALVRSGGAQCSADEVCQGDLRDSASLARAVEGVDWVFHAGARVSTSGCWEDFEATNVRGTAEIIRCAKDAGVRRIVHVSSLSVYAVPADGAAIAEHSAYDDAGGERGFYARSKLAADRLAVAAIREGAPVVVLRPGLLYGPGRVPPLGRRVIALGPLRVILASPDYLLPLAYVENVADALWLAARSESARGRAYTIVDQHVRQADYAWIYRKISGQRWVALYPPLSLVRGAVSTMERCFGLIGARAPISRHQVERTVRSATFLTDLAEEDLGWHPAVRVDEALRRTFAALRQDGGNGAQPRA